MKKFYDPAFIYSYLVFIGFYNYYIYYSYFDIKISNFLSLSEMLLSFLPLTFPILLFLLSLAFMYYYFGGLFRNRNENLNSDSNNNKLFEIKKDIISLKQLFIKKKSFRTYILFIVRFYRIIRDIISLAMIYIYPIYLIINLTFYRQFSLNFFSIETLLFLTFLWLSLSLLYLRITKREVILSIVFLTFSLITIYNRERAQKILVGVTEVDMEFEYNEYLKKTNSSIVFIGMTENYIFLRDLKSNENLIYKRSDIKLLKMKKTNFKKYFNEQYD